MDALSAEWGQQMRARNLTIIETILPEGWTRVETGKTRAEPDRKLKSLATD